ncbi:MAG TPA: cellulase family glycosylhydrolase [Lacipirellulaceae bacterium]|nr:cellulase family glycosylhydrolase [Lacipirellulaceae bacterium]
MPSASLPWRDWRRGGRRLACAMLLAAACLASALAAAAEKWSPEQARTWYASQPWLVGCNYAPSTAINQLEMWQGDSFDPATIDRELQWAHAIGFNTVRVFLHDLPWRDDREGFFRRIDAFLELADRHKIRPMIVLFDGVWDPDPQSGPQRRPRAGVHNSGWVQSPGRVILADPARQDQLKAYVTDVLEHYHNDPRVLLWDLFNEPDNGNGNSYAPLEVPNKEEAAPRLVKLAYRWARETAAVQPLTVGVWQGPPWDNPDQLNRVHRAALDLSDVFTFHDYGPPASMTARIEQLEGYGRPLICTEFMARGNGSTFAEILPILKQKHIGAYSWGLVDGKTQTKYPWSSWQMPTLGEPDPWHHDVFHADGRPYREAETALIRKLTSE